MKTHTRTYLAATLLISAVAGCHGPVEQQDLGDEELAIINGTPCLPLERLETVAVESCIPDRYCIHCSGTVISPTAVLTAGHCITSDDYVIADWSNIYFGNDDENPIHIREGAGWFSHPDYVPIPEIDHDIAIIIMTEAAPEEVVPVPHLPTQLGLDSDDIGADVELVGFGRDENGEFGIKRKITRPILGVGDRLLCIDQDEGGVCFGDSGGPGFMTFQGQEYVVSATSYVVGDCTIRGCNTLVDAYDDWIREVIGSTRVQGQACDLASQCYSGHCVEGYCCESACTTPCMSCGQDRQHGFCVVAADGFACLDGDVCNGDESCVGGVCVQGEALDCTTLNPCMNPACDPMAGCGEEPKESGIKCDNGDQCDGADTCNSGLCSPVGVPLDCDDGDPCTDDSCAPALGCQHGTSADGTLCSDENLCDGDEVCQDGQCVTGDPLDCDDNNACTMDSCDRLEGCTHDELPDGEDCGDCRSCQNGLCLPDGDCGSGCSTTRGRALVGWMWLPALLGFLTRRR